jgi:hypothetical protein
MHVSLWHYQMNIQIYLRALFYLKGYGNIFFLLFHFKELLKLYINLLYRFCVTLLFLEIFWLKIICCSPSWINFYLTGDFSDVKSRVSHIKLHLNDQITLSIVWKVVRLFQIVTEVYDFGLIITNCSMDKILAWPCLWCHMHIRQNYSIFSLMQIAKLAHRKCVSGWIYFHSRAEDVFYDFNLFTRSCITLTVLANYKVIWLEYLKCIVDPWETIYYCMLSKQKRKWGNRRLSVLLLKIGTSYLKNCVEYNLYQILKLRYSSIY